MRDGSSQEEQGDDEDDDDGISTRVVPVESTNHGRHKSPPAFVLRLP